jgi:transforming growth factor-beta-induced protein
MDMAKYRTRGALILALALGACGDDDSSDSPAPSPTADAGRDSGGGGGSPDASVGTSDAGRPDSGAAKSIVGTAVADGRFTTLAKALTDTGLLTTLEGQGPFTVFAPTDAAFAALPPGTLDGLSKEQLTTILTYHAIAGRVPSSALKAGPVTTVSTFSAFVSLGGGVKVNDATVTTADVNASNGVIHVIDKVLLPPNLVQAAQYAGSFTSLVGAVTTAGLAETLSAPAADLTVFAPTDAAFSALPPGTVAGLSPSALADLLKYHVVAGKKPANTLASGSVPTLLSGKNVAVTVTGSAVKVNDANVVIADVVTTNGIIHAIDKVLSAP